MVKIEVRMCLAAILTKVKLQQIITPLIPCDSYQSSWLNKFLNLGFPSHSRLEIMFDQEKQNLKQKLLDIKWQCGIERSTRYLSSDDFRELQICSSELEIPSQMSSW